MNSQKGNKKNYYFRHQDLKIIKIYWKQEIVDKDNFRLKNNRKEVKINLEERGNWVAINKEASTIAQGMSSVWPKEDKEKRIRNKERKCE